MFDGSGVSVGIAVAVIRADCNTQPSYPSGLITCSHILPSTSVASGKMSSRLPFRKLLTRLPSKPGVLRMYAPPPVSADIHARMGVLVGVKVMVGVSVGAGVGDNVGDGVGGTFVRVGVCVAVGTGVGVGASVGSATWK